MNIFILIGIYAFLVMIMVKLFNLADRSAKNEKKIAELEEKCWKLLSDMSALEERVKRVEGGKLQLVGSGK